MPPQTPEEQEAWQKQKEADLAAEREKHNDMRVSNDENRLEGDGDRVEEQTATPVTDQSAPTPATETPQPEQGSEVVEETVVEETVVEETQPDNNVD